MTGRRPCAFWGCPQNSAHARGVETVALSSEGPLDNGHMRRYTKVARSDRTAFTLPYGSRLRRRSLKPFIPKVAQNRDAARSASTRWDRWQRQPATLAVGSTRLMPSLVTSLRETANVGSLAGMLHCVADHADEPDCGGHRGIPAGVDDPIQLLGSKAIQVAQRHLVDIAVILAEQVATHADRRYLFRALAVTGSPLVKRQPKPFPPLRPHLVNVRQVGDLMVLAAG